MDNFVNFGSYTLDSFHSTGISTKNSLNIFHHNSRSILAEGRLEEYNAMFKSLNNPFQIMAFTETWLRPDNEDIADFAGYEPFHHWRKNDNPNIKEGGGGISVFIKEGIRYKVRYDLNVTLSYMETLFVEVKYNDKNYMLGIVYRIPNTNVDSFINKINEIIEPIRNNYELVLTGDFNICLLKNNNHSESFRNCMMSSNLFPTILEATRVANIVINGNNILTETLIDNFLINTQSSLCYKSGLIYSSISDHYPIFLSIPGSTVSDNINVKVIKYRLIDEYSIRKFKFALNSYISTLELSENATIAFEAFHNKFQELYDKYFPIKSKKVSRKSFMKPWVTTSLVNRLKIRDNLGRLASKGRLDRKIYTDFRNKVTKQLRELKSLYYNQEFAKNNGNIKKTWDTINSSIKKKNIQNNVVLCENESMVEKKDIPNKFIDYLSNIPQQLVSEMPSSNTNVNMYLKNRQRNTFCLFHIQSNDVEDAISNLKNNGCGLFNFSTTVLDSIKSDISSTLANIFNLCSDQGYFPDELKTGCITPIHKKGDKTNISNYRPVCSLSPFSKIFEKIVNIRMLNFIDKYNIFSDTQFGFRKKLSTESALLSFTDYVHEGLTLKHNVGTLYMDLSKAFDVMDHDILETKLEHYGFRGNFLRFLMSFVRNRKYFVHINDLNSKTNTVNIGVPQGSTLGPLLFLLYVNDMKFSSSLLKFVQFADDTTLAYSCADFYLLQRTLEIEAKKVMEWLIANKLLVNLTKTHVMLFSFKRNIPKLSIKINNIELEEKTEINFLGVQIDNKLSWKAHIVHICNKVSKSIAILRLVRSVFPKNILKMIYMSLVYSYLNYCNLIWGAAEYGTIEPLFKLQKKAIRIITNSYYLEHTLPLFKNHKLLNVYQVYVLNCILFIYKCMKCNLFLNFKRKIKVNSDIHDHHTRRKELRVNVKARLKICKNSCLHFGIKKWNLLSSRLKSLNSIDYFKKEVKHCIIEQS